MSLHQRWKLICGFFVLHVLMSLPGVAGSVVTQVNLDQTQNSPSNKLHQMVNAVRRGVGLSVPLEWQPYQFWHDSLPLALLEYESEGRSVSLNSAAESDLEPVLKYIHLFQGVPSESILAIQEFLKKRFENKIMNRRADGKALSVSDNLILCFEYLLQVDQQLGTHFFINEVLNDLPRNLQFLSDARNSRDPSLWGARIWTQVSKADSGVLSRFFKIANGFDEKTRILLLKKPMAMSDSIMEHDANPFHSIYETFSESVAQEKDSMSKADLIRVAALSFPFLKSSIQFYQDEISKGSKRISVDKTNQLKIGLEDIPRSLLEAEIQSYKNLTQISLQAALMFMREMKEARLRTGLFIFYEHQFQQMLQKGDFLMRADRNPSSDTNPWPFIPSQKSLSTMKMSGSCDQVFNKFEK